MPLHRDHVTVDGLRLAFAETGQGAPVVLLHGAMTGLDDMLLALGPVLAARHRVIAFDRPGHGGSEGRWDAASIWTQAALFEAALAELGIVQPVLVAHSLGGAVALAMTQTASPAVRGLVALAPIAFPEARLEHLMFAPRATPGIGEALSFALMPGDSLLMPTLWRDMFAPQPIPEGFAARFPTSEAGERARLRTTGREAAWLIPDLTRAVAGYGRCRVPVQLLCGDRDRVVNPALHSARLARTLPHVSVETLPGIGHMVHHARPEVVAAAVERLLETAADFRRRA